MPTVPTILVIEDNPANMKLAELLLHNAGHATLTAGDAETGVALARELLPDLILMDIHLPGMDGLSVVKEMKTDARTRRIPILALTAHAMSGDREKAIAAGCDDYHPKPVDFARLLTQIDALTAAKTVAASR